MAKADVRIEYAPLSELERAPRNVKGHDLGVIHQSIDRFGYVQPILVNETTGRIVAGHGRLDTLAQRKEQGLDPPERVKVRADGEWLVPTIRGVAFADDHEAEAYLIADNRTVELGGWDEPALVEMLADLAEIPGGLDGVGYDADDIDRMIADLGGHRGKDDPDAAPPPPPDDPVTQPGDLWVLGDHRLVCGDSTDEGVVARLMDGALADMVWTDPPYGVEYEGKTADALTIANDGAAGLPGLLAGVFAAVDEYLAPGGRLYIAHPPGALCKAFLDAFVVRWKLHETLVWLKDRFVLGHSDYHYRHEPILYGYKAAPGRWGRGGEGWYGDNAQDSVFDVPRPSASEHHPTMKPVELVARALRNSSAARHVVLDPFGGSGTTLIAACETDRVARLVEISPAYCDVICARFQRHTGIIPTRDGVPHDFTSDA